MWLMYEISYRIKYEKVKMRIMKELIKQLKFCKV